MSSAEFEGDLKESGESTEDGQDNDQLASKLSKELSNWRRKRTSVWRDSTASREKRLKQNTRCRSSKNCRVIQLSRNPLQARIRSTSLAVAREKSALDASLEGQRKRGNSTPTVR